MTVVTSQPCLLSSAVRLAHDVSMAGTERSYFYLLTFL